MILWGPRLIFSPWKGPEFFFSQVTSFWTPLLLHCTGGHFSRGGGGGGGGFLRLFLRLFFKLMPPKGTKRKLGEAYVSPAPMMAPRLESIIHWIHSILKQEN